jgi:hypothetical protein
MKPVVLALIAILAPAQSALTDRISAASLRGRVSFLASDLLEGRGTPSRGLEIAADYIASEFRRANLESPVNGEYSQIANFVRITDQPETIQFSLSGGGESPLYLSSDRMSVESLHAARLVNETVFKWAPNVKVEGSLAGKVLMLRAPSDPAIVSNLALARPDAIVQLTRHAGHEGSRSGRLIPALDDQATGPAMIYIPEVDVEGTFDRLPNGVTSAHASLHVGEPILTPALLRNVVGILRGSDPALRGDYVLVTAHYDHLGVGPAGEKDRIYNGANDNASGVATVIELAHAFAAENPRPRRTLVFLCFFGEEKGLFGSNWYVKHPLFPLARTVADINFEQLGEPQGNEGLQAGSIGVTGYDLTDLPESLEPDLERAGVTLRNTKHNDDYFERSDNLPFAEAGIPAHTFVAALEYPDYHRPSDTWPKLNYDNMARLDRGLALSILDIADRAEPPKWKDTKKTREYLNAWRALHP